MSSAREVTDNVFQLGTRHINWFVVADNGALTVVDAGLPRYWPQLTDLLSQIGRSVSDIEAVLLTHGDADHLGTAQRIAATGGARVFIHEEDQPLAERQVKAPAPRLPLWRLKVAAFMTHSLSHGITRYPAISPTLPLRSGTRLDVPGNPLAVHTPGHTRGSVCFAFDCHDAVFVGDAMVNLDPVTYSPGVSVGPNAITADRKAAVASLTHLEDLTHRTVLFGHGDPIYIGIGEAARQARAAYEEGR